MKYLILVLLTTSTISFADKKAEGIYVDEKHRQQIWSILMAETIEEQRALVKLYNLDEETLMPRDREASN